MKCENCGKTCTLDRNKRVYSYNIDNKKVCGRCYYRKRKYGDMDYFPPKRELSTNKKAIQARKYRKDVLIPHHKERTKYLLSISADDLLYIVGYHKKRK